MRAYIYTEVGRHMTDSESVSTTFSDSKNLNFFLSVLQTGFEPIGPLDLESDDALPTEPPRHPPAECSFFYFVYFIA